MKSLFVGLFVLGLLPTYAFSSTKTLCGTCSGTAGNAFLVKNGKVTIVLAEQGGDQRLLDQADSLLNQGSDMNSGTQNGNSYCVNVKFSKAGKILKIVGTYPEN